jgi:hypothetical protein
MQGSGGPRLQGVPLPRCSRRRTNGESERPLQARLADRRSHCRVASHSGYSAGKQKSPSVHEWNLRPAAAADNASQNARRRRKRNPGNANCRGETVCLWRLPGRTPELNRADRAQVKDETMPINARNSDFSESLQAAWKERNLSCQT